jgi:hypothetical protein
MRGHQGLSALSRTTRDYLHVVERFLDANAASIPAADRRAALFWAFARNARSVLWTGGLGDASALAARAALRVRSPAETREMGRLSWTILRNAAVRVRRGIARRGSVHPHGRS